MSRRIFRTDYQPPVFRIEAIDLRFDLALPITRVTSTLEFARQGEGSLVLDGERFATVSLALDGQPLAPDRYTIADNRLTLLDPPDRGRLTAVTDVDPFAGGMQGLIWLDGVFTTNCEPEGFRRITWFADRPDVFARWTVTLAGDPDPYPTLLSNGRLVEEGVLDDGRRYARWEDPHPKTAYVFSLLAGRFETLRDRFVTASGREVELAIHAQPADIAHCAIPMATLKRAMAWDEEAYGREYDLDVFNVGVIRAYPGGAMENKGLNLYATEFFLSSPEISTDEDMLRVEAVIGHEYFHNWTGNRVGVRDWFELSLKEGFTVLRQQQFMEARLGEAESRIDDMVRLRELQYAEDEGALVHPVRPQSYVTVNNFYTRTVYDKGAELIRMLRTLVGPEAFRRGSDAFFDRWDGRTPTIDALVDAVEEASGKDLGAFRRWWDEAGRPEVDVTGHHDPEARRYTLSAAQRLSNLIPDALPMPMRLGLLDKAGRPVALRLAGEAAAAGTERVLEVEGASTFVFEDVTERPTPSLFRGYSAPVELRADLTADDLLNLALHDPDKLNRWNAGQILAARAVLEGDAEPWLTVIARSLAEGRDDPGFTGRMVRPPSDRQFGQAQPVVDVDAIAEVRRALGRTVADRFDTELRALHCDLESRVGDAADFGARRLRNQALRYLDDPALARAQFKAAATLEDRLAAMRLLVDRGGDDRRWALEQAYALWRDTPATLDHWFAAQAASDAEDAPELVEALTRHPAYDLGSAPRLKAVFDTFCFNQAGFHHRSGAGYRVVADVALALNEPNPRLGSRFLKHFARWPRFDGRRQELMKAELRRILDTPDLAPDLFEVADKSLAVETVQ